MSKGLPRLREDDLREAVRQAVNVEHLELRLSLFESQSIFNHR
jgi:hypothetical protein